MSITCGDGTTVELAPRHHAMVNRRLDAEAATREIFAAVATGATVMYCGQHSIVVSKGAGYHAFYEADADEIDRAVINALTILWGPLAWDFVYDAVFDLHFKIHGNVANFPYEADQLEPAIVMVRRHWKSGREDILEQLLALMKGEVHQEAVTT